MTSKEQRMFGVTDVKLKLLDVLIDLSIKTKGRITTGTLKGIRDGLDEYSKKMEVVESIEEGNEKTNVKSKL
jgi:hypothetical protein